jgi:16S rRNA (uracil1498-N3)-methyltransferase
VTLHRFCVPDCRAGAIVSLPVDLAHHARSVVRLRAGARVQVFDGRGHAYDATLQSVTRVSVVARIGASVAPSPESPLRVTLVFAPLAADLTSLVIQKSVELGVSELRPLLTARTEAAGRALCTPERIERLRRIAVAATAQCGRAYVPDVRPFSFDELLTTAAAGPKLLCCERSVARPFPALPCPPSQVLLAIGPAGGWDDAEIERAVAAGFALVALGPRILRAETAALAALSAVQLMWGDLMASPWEERQD